jgi:hypothetical protein
MQVSRTLRFLSLPAALGLGAALAVACSDGAPTAPDQTPSFVTKQLGGAYDAISTTTCAAGYFLTQVNNFGSGADTNGDGWVCKKGTPKKK